MKQVVIFIAPPGAGKGTQADRLAEKFGFFHLESAKVIEDKFVSNPENPDVKLAQEQWRTGILVEPRLLVLWMSERIRELVGQGKNIVFSGSPRTLFEAEAMMPLLEELIGKNNIKIFNITLSADESIKRNSNRRICKANRHPIPSLPEFENITTCPQDGSEVMRRALDKPEIIKDRLVEYQNRTAPVLDFLIKKNYEIMKISGEQGIENVSEDILSHFS